MREDSGAGRAGSALPASRRPGRPDAVVLSSVVQPAWAGPRGGVCLPPASPEWPDAPSWGGCEAALPLASHPILAEVGFWGRPVHVEGLV